MNCRECMHHQDDYLDNLLDHTLYDEIQRHLAECSDCQEIMRQNREMLQTLRNMAGPTPSPGFLNLALKNAIAMEKDKQRKKWWYQFAAVAAMVCLVVLGSMGHGHNPTSITTQQTGITLSLHDSKEVILMVQSAKTLENATITIELPPQLMLANNPNLREFSWQANVKEGKNFIPLPLIATGNGQVSIIAKIEHDNKIKTMRMEVHIINPAV